MSNYDYDLFVIGAGSGGVRAARLASIYGARVAIAEVYRIGGTCVIRGCVPKKFMVYASHFAEEMEDARGYGWSWENAAFDWTRFATSRDDEIKRLSGIYFNNLRKAGVEVFQSRAEFVDAHTLRLSEDGRTVTADKILIAVGGYPSVDERIQGHDLAITSNEAFHLPKVPEHIVIAGGGYIAVEFAGIFNGLGSKVCLVYRGEDILRTFDSDISIHVHDEMKRKGVRILTETVFKKIEQIGDQKRVHLSDGETIDTDAVMWAIGRKPNTGGVGVANAGVELDRSGAVIVDDWSQTSAQNVFAVGDVTNRMNLTPVAIREGAAFAETHFNNNPMKMDYTNVAKAVFSQPPVGTVGLTEAEARAERRKVDVYRAKFRPMKHMLSGNEERTLMKLVVDAQSDQVLGCHIVGPDAAEMIQCLAVAVKMGATKAEFDATCAVHPTVAEEIVTLREKVATSV